MASAVAKMEDAFREMADGTLVAPPRFRVEADSGGLVFTAGAANQEQVIGFRVYGTFPRPAGVDEQDQLVVVYDTGDGSLKGLVIGRLLGATRTGAIGGVAIKHLARPDAAVLAIIGVGYQARTQAAVAVAVRNFREVRLFSRSRAKAEQMAVEIGHKTRAQVWVMPSAQAAVEGADVVIGATTSPRPVLESNWLRPGVHVTTIGPQFADAHEMPLDIADRCRVIATDSLAQVTGYGRPFFISDLERLTGLDQIVSGQAPGRTSPDDITLFCSVGLAGTEVVLANYLLGIGEQELGIGDRGPGTGT